MPPIAFRLKEEQGGKAGRPTKGEEAGFPPENKPATRKSVNSTQ